MQHITPRSQEQSHGLEVVNLILLKSFQAGILLSLAVVVFLVSTNQLLGAVLCSAIVYMMCELGMPVLMFNTWNMTKDTKVLFFLLCAFGNCLGCALSSLALKYVVPSVAVRVAAICEIRMARSYEIIFLAAFFCGALITAATQALKGSTGLTQFVGLFICMNIYLLCGLEHAIMDVALFFLHSTHHITEAALFTVCVLGGNAIGTFIFSRLKHLPTKHT